MNLAVDVLATIRQVDLVGTWGYQRTDRGLRSLGAIEFDNTSATRTAVGLVLDLGTLDLADSGEEVNQILIAGRPRKLQSVRTSFRQSDKTPSTYVANVDSSALLAARGSKVGEGVRWDGSSSLVKAGAAISRATTEATAATETRATKTTTTAEAATATKTRTTKATTATETAATGTSVAWVVSSEAILADLQGTALPLVSVELGDSVAGIIRVLESHNTGSLGTAGGVGVNIGANNSALLS